MSRENDSSKPTKRVRRSSEQMWRLLADYRSSGLTQKAFAESRKVPLSTLTNWLRRMRSSVGADLPDSPAGGFVEAEVSVAAGSSHEALGADNGHDLELMLGEEVGASRAVVRSLRLRRGFCAEDLSRALNVIGKHSKQS